MSLKTIFMGTPDFSVPVLGALLDAGHSVACVYCQPPRPAGRGQQPRPSPVQAFAEARGLLVRTPHSLRDSCEHEAFAALGADVAVVAAYGLILPPPVLAAPRLGCVNVHASLLPRWRGAAPIQRAIMAGDAETGVTIMQMEAGLDTGPMLLRRAVPITAQTTAGGLHDQLSGVGAALLVEALAALAQGRLTATPQPEAGVTYAGKIIKEEARIEWFRPAADLLRHIHGLSPFPGAWFERDGERIKVLEVALADLAPPPGTAPGTVLDDRGAVACGRGAVRLVRVQRAGKAAVPAEAFLRGYDLRPGTVLS